ncbi:CASP-like protein 4D1 [Diospyros lotus]|uniref:CASP-like protein 4D1 n=1 Tax=Diospyros lotus TaxID=55363 RepID=UPI00225862B7|nr:CASP-like protein 4D1 [Diospyros lotus]
MNGGSSRYQFQSKAQASKLPLVAAAARALTIVSVVIALAITKSNQVKLPGDDRYNYYLLSYKYVISYRYALAVILLAAVHNALQMPFAVYYAIRRKRLLNHSVFLKFEFYGDKIISYALGTAAGAYFGVTVDGKRSIKYAQKWESKYNDFYNLAFVAAGFLLLGFLSCVASSFISSLAASQGEDE